MRWEPRPRRSRSTLLTFRESVHHEPDDVDAMARLTDAILVLSEQLDVYRVAVKLHQGSAKTPPNALRAAQLYETVLRRREHADCMHALACLLERGAPGVAPDAARAISLYSLAIKRNGNTASMFRLASVLETGSPVVQKDTFRACALYARLVATEPHLQALRRLASMLLYAAERGIADPRRAARYLQRAIDEFSDVDSMLLLASILIEGHRGIPSNPSRAMRLFDRAVREGSRPAMLQMADILLHGTYGVRSDPSYALCLYERAVNKFADVGAMLSWAEVLRRGSHGIPSQPAKAVQLYELAVKEGDSIDAMFALAFMLIADMGVVAADPVYAVCLFLKAVENGGLWDEWWTTEFSVRSVMDAEEQEHRAELLLKSAALQCEDLATMIRLADMLLMGSGLVDPNPEMAAGLYVRALENYQDTRATRALADILVTGLFMMKADPDRAIELYSGVAEREADVASMLDLSHVLLTGLHGVKPNVPRSIELLVAASSAAPTNITILRLARGALLNGPQSNPARVLQLYETATARTDVDVRALTDFADLLANEPRRAAPLYRRAAERGNPYAMYRLAGLLRLGADGVPANKREALRLCEHASAYSSHALCLLYVMLGQRAQETGSQRDLKRARRALRRASEREGNSFVHDCLREIPGKGELDVSFSSLRNTPTMPRIVRPLYTTAFRNY